MRILLALLLLCLPASARLGETVEQIKARYGPPNEQFPRQWGKVTLYKYRFQAVPVEVEFVEGVSQRETFHVIGDAGTVIMKAWSGGKNWQPGRNLGPSQAEYWFGKLIAVIDSKAGTLTLTTKESPALIEKAWHEEPPRGPIGKGF